MTNIAAGSNFHRMATMAKTDEVVSPKMIPVVQGIVEWIEAHIFDTLPVSAIAKKSGYSHWYFQRQFAIAIHCPHPWARCPYL